MRVNRELVERHREAEILTEELRDFYGPRISDIFSKKDEMIDECSDKKDANQSIHNLCEDLDRLYSLIIQDEITEISLYANPKAFSRMINVAFNGIINLCLSPKWVKKLMTPGPYHMYYPTKSRLTKL